MPELTSRKQRPFDTAFSPYEHRLNIRSPTPKFGGDRQRRHQMPARPSTGNQDGAHSALDSRAGRPRILPMFTSMPVATSEMIKLERP